MLNEIWMIQAKMGKRTWMVFGSSQLPVCDEEEAQRLCNMWKESAIVPTEYKPVKYYLASK